MYNPEKLATYCTQEEEKQNQSTTQEPLYTNNKEWLARNHDNVPEWDNMSICGMSIP